MKIGSFVIRRERKVRATIADKVSAHIGGDQVREAIARMARSEVKNYLAELAEAAEIAFVNPAHFLALVKKYASYSIIDGTSATFINPEADNANSDSL